MSRLSHCKMTMMAAASAVALMMLTEGISFAAQNPDAEYELECVAANIQSGEYDKAIKRSQEVAARYWDDLDITLRAVHFMAQAYEGKDEVGAELRCYQQTTACAWRPILKKPNAERMRRRMGEIAEKLLADNNPKEILKYSQVIMELLEAIGGVANSESIVASLHKACAEALDAAGDQKAARESWAKIINLPTEGRIKDRFKAAMAFLNSGGEAGGGSARDNLVRMMINSNDADVLFICQAALAQTAIERAKTHKEFWPEAIERLEIAFSLCPALGEHIRILQQLCGQLADGRAATGLEKPTIKALFEYAVSGAQGEDGKIYTPDDIPFPLRGARGNINSDEEAAIKQKIEAVGSGTQERLRRGRLWMLINEVDKAAVDFQEAYKYSARGTERQIVVIDALLSVAKTREGKFINPEPFYVFLAFGKAGRDGKPETADDLQDPFVELMTIGSNN